MRKNMEGSEFPDLDHQDSSMSHTDRYKFKSQKIKSEENSSNNEKERVDES